MMEITVGLMPVVAFLCVLLYLDSYKLVKLTDLLGIVVLGGAVAVISYFLNGWALDAWDIDRQIFSRYIAPLFEEGLKCLIVLVCIRMRRIGFLVDAAIFGFAVGTGFALVENIYYLGLLQEAGIGIWIVRGFGTAIMHGGATAVFAVMGLAVLERAEHVNLASLVPGFGLAVLAHSAYNHLAYSPRLSAIVMLVVMPPLLYFIMRRSELAVGDWLGKGFDADTEMLELINSGRLSNSPVGAYIHSLRDKFHGPVVADIICYIRLFTELALRAKGMLLMRENGFKVQVDEATHAKFAEMRYLEKSIGRTGLLAIQPMLHMSHKDLWQLYMLGK